MPIVGVNQEGEKFRIMRRQPWSYLEGPKVAVVVADVVIVSIWSSLAFGWVVLDSGKDSTLREPLSRSASLGSATFCAAGLVMAGLSVASSSIVEAGTKVYGPLGSRIIKVLQTNVDDMK